MPSIFVKNGSVWRPYLNTSLEVISLGGEGGGGGSQHVLTHYLVAEEGGPKHMKVAEQNYLCRRPSTMK